MRISKARKSLGAIPSFAIIEACESADELTYIYQTTVHFSNNFSAILPDQTCNCNFRLEFQQAVQWVQEAESQEDLDGADRDEKSDIRLGRDTHGW